MKNLLSLLRLACLFLALSKTATAKTNVLIATTAGGGGHLTAAKAVVESLSSDPEADYSFQLIDVNDFDLLSRMIRDCWDELGRSGNFEMLKWGCHFKGLILDPTISATSRLRHEFKAWTHIELPILTPQENLMRSLIKMPKADLIVSVVNTWNQELVTLARAWGVPIRIIPTDFEVSGFLAAIKNHEEVDLKVYLPSEHEEVTRYCQDHGFTYKALGYPISFGFAAIARQWRNESVLYKASREADKLEAFPLLTAIKNRKEALGIGENDRSLFVMMGAKGFDSQACIDLLDLLAGQHAGILAPADRKLWFLIASGQNPDFVVKLAALKQKWQAAGLDERVTLLDLGRLSHQDVAFYWALSQGGFVKAGGASTAEQMALGKFGAMLLNDIPHEQFNAKFAQKLGLVHLVSLTYRENSLHPLEIAQQLEGFYQNLSQHHLGFLPTPLLPPLVNLSQAVKNNPQLPPWLSNRNSADAQAIAAIFREVLAGRGASPGLAENRFHENFQKEIASLLAAP